ncbi:MAG: conjugal transfer protein TraD [Caulobacteraceae bacterium]
MRKPQDIDAEIKARKDQIKTLKALRVRQFGELVVATGADGLDHVVLAGVLLAAVEASKQPESLEAWRRKGAGFFQRQPAGKSEGGPGDIGSQLEANSGRAAAG